MNALKKTTALLFSALLTLSFAGAQCLSGDCRNGDGIIVYPDGKRYIGQFSEGEKHGEGTLYYLNESRYHGQWANDLPHGEGFRLFKDGTRLEGLWEKGRLIRRKEKVGELSEYVERGGQGATGCVSGNCYSGKGIYIFPSGAVYVGEFRNGEIHGFGVCYFANGSKYQGQWMHRYPDGRGIKTYADGSRRTGYWKRGQPVDELGNLVVELIDTKEAESGGTDVQSGCISGNCKDGQGLFAYPDGSRYEGQFLNGKPEGWGTFHDINGDRYTGSFHQGYRHGNGKLHREDGRVITGRWAQGEYTGKVTSVPKLGCLQGDCENGYGTYRFKDNSKYIGTFQNFLPHGEGVVYYSNGERYEGGMARGAFQGKGTLYRLDGSQVSGQWENGTFVGARPSTRSSWPAYTTPPGTDQSPRRLRPKMKVWAVIIGIAAYNHMPVLRYTDDDAYRIYAFLKSPEGGALDDSQIRILIDEDATKQKIVSAMEKTFSRAGPNDLVFLYFSGHGLKGSFLPFDFDGYNNKLFHAEINQLLDRSPAKYKFCIADACHSGSLLAMRSGAELPTLMSYYESLARARPGTALIMSSKSDETSLESSGLRQGVFSHFLIRGLKGEADLNANRIVSVQELFDFVRSNVRNYTANRQSPVIQGDYDKTMTVSVVR